jgi:hypothetical protein
MIGPMLRHCPDLGIKSIFVPLHTEHWNAFRDRRKSIEWRAWGARWNDRTITPGRTIILFERLHQNSSARRRRQSAPRVLVASA